MIAWVIQRIETKKYLNAGRYFDNLCGAILFKTKHFAEREINIYIIIWTARPLKCELRRLENEQLRKIRKF